MSWPKFAPFLLLTLSNVFMTVAWYGHLKYRAAPILAAILASWAIALAEYSLAVPANRVGATVYSLAQLKTIQEVIAITVFIGYAVWVAGETLRPGQLLGFAFLGLGAALVFRG
ncbi:MAG: DMT family protein [Pseudomonadota bacterium]